MLYPILLFALVAGVLALPVRYSRRPRVVGPVAGFIAATPLLLVWLEGHGGPAQKPRLAPIECFGYLIVAAALYLLGRRASARSAAGLVTCAFSLIVLGMIVFAERALQLHLVYDWLETGAHPRVTAIGFTLLGAGFWLRWHRTAEYTLAFAGREDRRIAIIAAGILVVCSLLAGLAGIVATVRETERLLTQSLAVGLDHDVAQLEQTVAAEHRMLAALADHDSLNEALERSRPGEPPEPFRIAFGSQYRHVVLRTHDGAVIAERGSVAPATLDVPLPRFPGASLLWSGELALRLRHEIAEPTGTVRTLEAVVAMPESEAMLRDPHRLGDTASLNLCVEAGSEHIRCFPSRHEAQVTTRPKRFRGGAVPMLRAIRGEDGVSGDTLDTRGRHVLAAFQPVPTLGLNAVLKIQSVELYEPIVTQLSRAVPFLFVFVLLGVLLLNAQLSPLVRSILSAERSASQMSHALARSERQTRAILDAVSDGIVGLEEDATIRSSNPAISRLLGGSPEQFIGRRLTDFVVQRDKAAELMRLCQLARAEPGSGDERAVSLELRRVDGTRVEVEITIDIAELGEPLAVAIVRDITRQRYMERMKDQFVSTVSHELRTPLTAIRGSLGLVTGGIGGPLSEASTKLLRIANENCERLIDLINDILDIQKMAAGRLGFEFRPVRLTSVIDSVIEAMRPYATLQRVELVLAPGGEQALVLADRDRLNQALTNLVSNAIKYSPPQGQVRVEVSAANEAWRISVTDAGVGIPESFRDRIFQPFAQADSSVSRSKGGTGLGLFITKGIIERHRGKLDYVTAETRGTTFFIELPECQVASETPTTSLAPEGQGLSRLARILHVEADSQCRVVMSELLSDIALVAGASTHTQALALLEDGGYDLVVVDLELGGAVTSDLLQTVHRRKLASSIVVYTARDELADASVRRLADDVFIKTRIPERELKLRILEHLSSSGRFEQARVVHGA